MEGATGSYQVGMTWMRAENGWRFPQCPIVELDGTVAATVSSAAAGTIDFALSVRNQSQTTWKRALAWLCFNHSHAMEYYRYRNFVCCDTGVVTTPPKTEEHYCLPGHDRDWWSKRKVYPQVPFIGTRCAMDREDPFCVAIAAEEAIMVEQSPGWPCTDIARFSVMSCREELRRFVERYTSVRGRPKKRWSSTGKTLDNHSEEQEEAD